MAASAFEIGQIEDMRDTICLLKSLDGTPLGTGALIGLTLGGVRAAILTSARVLPTPQTALGASAHFFVSSLDNKAIAITLDPDLMFFSPANEFQSLGFALVGFRTPDIDSHPNNRPACARFLAMVCSSVATFVALPRVYEFPS